MQGDALFDNLLTKQTYSPADINYVIGHFITGKNLLLYFFMQFLESLQ